MANPTPLVAQVTVCEPIADPNGSANASAFHVVAIVTDGIIKAQVDVPAVSDIEVLKSILRTTSKQILKAQSTLKTIVVGQLIDLSDTAITLEAQARNDFLALQAEVYSAQRQIAAGILSASDPTYLALLDNTKKALKPEYIGLT